MALSSLLRRMGFVKLDEFGLILTPEGRILSARSVVLDDGLGGKIVGWHEDDLAAMELERWEPALPPKKKTVIRHQPLPPAAVTIAPAAPPPVPVRAKGPTLPGMPPISTPIPVPVPAAKSAPVPVITKPVAAPVAPVVVEEDDEWEWEIAVARARAAAEWAAEAAETAAAAPALAPARPRPKRATSPIAIVAEPPKKRDPIQADHWPQTEPLMETWETNTNTTDRSVRVLPRAPSPTPPKPIVIPNRMPLRAPAPTPAVATMKVGDQTSPTVQTSAAPRAAVTSWTNVGTGTKAPWASRTADPWPAAKTTPNAELDRKMAPPRRIPHATPPQPPQQPSEDTLVNQGAAPANDDLTSPSLLLPSPASSSKRVAAKQR